MKIMTMLMLAAVLSLLVFACVTPDRTEPEQGGAVSYYGYGTGSSMIQALNNAKTIALKDAVVEMIGAPSAAAHRQELDELFFRDGKAGPYLPGDRMSIINQSESEGMWRVEIMAVVDLFSVEKVLRSNGIYGGKVIPGGKPGSGAVGARGTQAQKEEAFETYMESELAEEDGGSAPAESAELTDDERRFIREYVEQMTYMVYFNEDSPEDPFLMKAGVGIANKALAEEAAYTVDLAQIEAIKRDQEFAYEEETGRSISMIQWIAGKLNADVYIELDAVTSGESRGGNYYGQANITLKVFDASTAQLLGSVPYNSPETFSTSSEFDARTNALQSSIYQAMPMALNQANVYMKKALERGIRYDLVVLNTPDARMMSNFRKKMRRKARSVKTVSASPEQTVYQVYLIGSIEDLEDIVYDVSETIPGFEGMERVYFRGKSITFTTGL